MRCLKMLQLDGELEMCRDEASVRDCEVFDGAAA